ncbi:MAG: zf-HC2 domain-containing protein [Cyanobacteria bacterium]|nr:zf-HC2 domain-containing protein [Cyanobacteriota bacterium]
MSDMLDGRDNCTQFQELLSAYYDQELSVDEEREVANHLEECAECKVTYAEIAEISTSLGKLPSLFLDQDFGDRLESLIAKPSVSDCSAVEPLLSAHLDHELSADEKPMVEKHLGSCHNCQSELNDLEIVFKSLSAVPRMNLDRDLADEIVAKIVSEQKEEKVPAASTSAKILQFKPRTIWAIGAIACAFGLLFIAPLTTSTSNTPVTVATKQPSNTVQPNQNKGTDASEKVAEVRQNPVEKTPESVDSQKKDSSATGNQHVMTPQHEIASGGTDRTSKPAIATLPKPDAKANARTNNAFSPSDLVKAQESVVAYAEPFDDSNMFEDLGISTDEDGLYAIKL